MSHRLLPSGIVAIPLAPLHLLHERSLNHLRIAPAQSVPLRTPARLIPRIPPAPAFSVTFFVTAAAH
jgi:hypothetical protein